MAKRKQSSRKPTNPLDRASEGRPRGRPGVRASEIEGRAYHYRLIFEEIWDVVGESLLKAQTEENVIQVLQRDGRYTNEFAPIASLVLEVLRDPDFPKRKREAQIGFLADWLAGRGWITHARPAIFASEGVREKSTPNTSSAARSMWNALAATKVPPSTMPAGNAKQKFLSG